MRNKIVILTYSLGGAGAERVVANLLNHLNRDKYDIHLVLMNTDIEYEIYEDQRIHYIEQSYRYESEFKKFIKLPLLAWRFARYCRKEQIELVLAVMSRPNLVAGMSRLFGTKSKLLISERCYTPQTYTGHSFIGKIKVALLKFCYPKADAILPNSRGTIEALQKIYGIQSKYHLVKNPTDIQKISRLADEPLIRHMHFDRFTFINVATFREEKNQDLIIDAIEEIKDLDFQLILIGKGETLDRIKKRVDDAGLHEKVLFINFTDNPFQYMSRSDCFLLSSMSEGFPNVLIESMVCNLPILSVDCKTGPRELLAPSTSLDTTIGVNEFEIAEYGLLCANNCKTSLAMAMKWVIANKEKLNHYKQKGAERVKDFEITKVCDEFSLIFDQYLKRQ
jgi:N-acetylgalactosamine-N,N'-diacetylbacillosaminyl-diphospho-undecaprenol 4-alpha-N-acetylgalactosaminyltransferase